MTSAFNRKIPVALLLAALTLFGAGAGFAQESVCLQCHGSQPGTLGEPVGLWRTSIHAQNGNSCHGCHGGDPTDFGMAMAPERGFLGAPQQEEIPAFCGRCHVGVLEDYLQSAHGKALTYGGPNCATCHSAHDVKKASIELINAKDCSRCHEYGRAEEIKSAMTETETMIGALELQLAGLHRVGIDTEAMRGELFSLRNSFHRLFHSVDVEKVRRQTGEIQEGLDGVKAKVAGIEATLSKRKTAGGIVVALLLLAGMLALLIRRTYQQEE